MVIAFIVLLIVQVVKGDYVYDIPADLTTHECVGDEYGGWPGSYDNMQESISSLYSAHASFELPVQSAVLFLLSRGSRYSGRLDISVSEELDSKTVAVNITSKSYHRNMIDETRVCRVTRGSNENGVGIFVSPFNFPAAYPR